jgi:glycosyltransferase involved in cell wall biosynthesis
MIRHYDIVQCYATESIRVLLNGKRPYVAFEHGTLRQFTMANDPQHRLTALAYRMADHCFITNGDCLAYAKQLGIKTYSPIVHPVDVEQHRRSYGDAIDELRDDIDADVILFCPARHDWDIKGTDQFIRTLPLIKKRLSKRVKMILIEWGRQLEDAKKLIKELGCTEDVIWKSSMCRITTIKYMRAADIVLDQMILPVFGAIAPQAIAAGRPVIASYVPEQTLWLIPEPAPILSAFCPEDIVDAVILALDPDWLADYEVRARRWIDTYHHPNVVITEHLRVYRSILDDARAGGEMPAPAQRSIAGDARRRTARVHE